jgi:hypothetical protein
MVSTLSEAEASVRTTIHRITSPPEVRPVSKTETVSLLMTLVYELLETYDANPGGLMDYGKSC